MKDIYLKFNGPDVKSESTDKDHSDWMEIFSWRHQIKQPKSATASSVGGQTAERCEHELMEFTKEIDRVSPQLYQHCSGGTTFKDVTAEFMRSDGDGKRVKYLEVNLKNVIVSEIAPEVENDGFPKERLGLSYGAIEWKYTQQKGSGGSGGSSQGAWSLTKNDKTFSV